MPFRTLDQGPYPAPPEALPARPRRAELTGDSAGKKLARSAARAFDKIAREHKDTPSAVLARREALTALGLEWKPKAK